MKLSTWVEVIFCHPELGQLEVVAVASTTAEELYGNPDVQPNDNLILDYNRDFSFQVTGGQENWNLPPPLPFTTPQDEDALNFNLAWQAHVDYNQAPQTQIRNWNGPITARFVINGTNQALATSGNFPLTITFRIVAVDLQLKVNETMYVPPLQQDARNYQIDLSGVDMRGNKLILKFCGFQEALWNPVTWIPAKERGYFITTEQNTIIGLELQSWVGPLIINISPFLWTPIVRSYSWLPLANSDDSALASTFITVSVEPIHRFPCWMFWVISSVVTVALVAVVLLFSLIIRRHSKKQRASFPQYHFIETANQNASHQIVVSSL